MKKFNRIFLCFVTLGIILFGSYGMVEEFGDFSDFFKDLKENTFLLIPIYFTLFSVFSFLFNLKKFSKDISVSSTTYKVLRIGDFLFSLSLITLIFAGLYFYFDAINLNKLKLKLLPLFIMLFLLFFAILDLTDNILYHKKQMLFLKKESIDDIKGM